MMSGQKLANYRKPAEERGVHGAFESDMRLTARQMSDILHQQGHREQVNDWTDRPLALGGCCCFCWWGVGVRWKEVARRGGGGGIYLLDIVPGWPCAG